MELFIKPYLYISGTLWWCLTIFWLPVICIYHFFIRKYRRLSEKQDVIFDSKEEKTDPLGNKSDSSEGELGYPGEESDCPERDLDDFDSLEELESDFLVPKVDANTADHNLRVRQIGNLVQTINRQLIILHEKYTPRTPEECFNARRQKKLWKMRRGQRSQDN
ncbi:uncharacterized protein LOC108044322 [Drosophila rhopaloa]|uniref:Uncharacterized protein LOC108044322 n=1 Tax=Drosophila rhopaloa TaxID=1041015 RepID=A0A6P4EQ86_DRORH|nr:uncharacterized protein LOC108044322 [Drosophila rhopaloa]